MSGRVYSIGIVGESHYQDAISRKHVGERVDLVPEPDNPHDPRAIRVDNYRGQTIGYVPRDSWLADAIIDEGKDVYAEIASVSKERNSGNLGVVIEVEIMDDRPRRSKAKVTSGKEGGGSQLGAVLRAGLGCVSLVIILAALVQACSTMLE